jgi:isopentenyl phosphate kinase
MREKTRIVAVILAISIVLLSFPVGVFAENDTTSQLGKSTADLTLGRSSLDESDDDSVKLFSATKFDAEQATLSKNTENEDVQDISIGVQLTTDHLSDIYEFTPSVSGVYTFQSVGVSNYDYYAPNAYLRDTNGNVLDSDCPAYSTGVFLEYGSFSITCNLIAGNTYYLEATSDVVPLTGQVFSYTYTITEPIKETSGANVDKENAYEISSGETIDVELSINATSRWYEFTPSVSGTYTFQSESVWNSDDYAPNAYLRDIDGSVLDSDCPTYSTGVFLEYSSFSITCNLIAGNTYYLEATSDVTPSTGEVFGYTYMITAPNKATSGANVNKENAYEINSGETIDVELSINATSRWYEFTPSVSGTYTFQSESVWNSDNYAPNAYLHDIDGSLLDSDCPAYSTGIFLEYELFFLTVNLIAGNTYYLEATSDVAPSTGQVFSYTYTITAPIKETSGTNVDKENAYEINSGETIDVELSINATSRWYEFTPSISGTYTFQSESVWNSDDYAPNAYLRDNDGSVLDSDCPAYSTGVFLEYSSFSITCNLIAGNTYYLEATSDVAPSTGQVFSYTYTITAPIKETSGANVDKENAYEINSGETIDVELSINATSRWYEFTPSVSGVYTFQSVDVSNSDDYAPNAYLRDNDGSVLDSDCPAYSTGIFLEYELFFLTVNLIAGNTYYLEATSDVVPLTGQVFSYTYTITAPIKETSGANVDKENAYEIKSGETIDVELSISATSRWYEFTPSVSGVYTFQSEDVINRDYYNRGSFNPYAVLSYAPNLHLYDINGELDSDCPAHSTGVFLEYSSFSITCNLIAGNTYYLEATSDVAPSTGEVFRYTFSVSTPSPIPPRIQVGTHTWSFKNLRDEIIDEYYNYFFDPAQAVSIKEISSYGTEGQCFGMVASAININNNKPLLTSFNSVYSNLADVREDDFSSDLNMTADDYIKLGYIYQYLQLIVDIKVRNTNRLGDLYGSVRKYETDEGRGVEIGVFGRYNGENGGHSLWGYATRDYTDRSEILVYDCNHPNDNDRILTLYKTDGEYTSWKYQLFDGFLGIGGTEWGTNKENARITYTTVSDELYTLLRDKSPIVSDNNNWLVATDSPNLGIVNGVGFYSNLAAYEPDNDTLLPIRSTGVLVDDNYQGGEEPEGIIIAPHMYWMKNGSNLTFTNIDKDSFIRVADGKSGIEVSSIYDGSQISMSVDDDSQNAVYITQEAPSNFNVNVFRANDDNSLENIFIEGIGNENIIVSETSSGIEISGVSSVDITYECNGETDILTLDAVEPNTLINISVDDDLEKILALDQEEKHSITATATIGGTISGNGTYIENATVTLIATSDTNYVFEGWYENGSKISGAGATYTFSATADRTLEARFTPTASTTIYTITATAVLGGSVSGGNAYEENATVTLVATPNIDYIFEGWYENGVKISEAEATYSFTATTDRTLEARFTPTSSTTTHTITATAGLGGSVSGGNAYEENTTVTLVATPDTNYTFEGWYENDAKISGAGATYSFSATADRTLEARFTPTSSTTTSYTITATADIGGSVSGGGTYNANDTVTLTATSNPNYAFESWYENGAIVSGAGATYSFSATVDRTLEARFTPTSSTTSYTITATAGLGGSVSGGNDYEENATVTLIATPDTGYVFEGWYENDAKISGAGATYSFSATADRTLEARFTFSENSNSNSDSSSSTNSVNSSTDSTVLSLPKLSTKMRNVDFISLSDLRTIAALAVKEGEDPWLNVDTLNAERKSVDVRVGINPTLAKKDMNFAGYTDNPRAKRIRMLFEKFFSNEILSVINLTQKGDFGQIAKLCVRVAPDTNVKDLVIYSYDSKTNKYHIIPEQNTWIDANSYLHFDTFYANDILVSVGSLSRRADLTTGNGVQSDSTLFFTMSRSVSTLEITEVAPEEIAILATPLVENKDNDSVPPQIETLSAVTLESETQAFSTTHSRTQLTTVYEDERDRGNVILIILLMSSIFALSVSCRLAYCARKRVNISRR